jgi:Nuclear pore complex assembly
MMVITISVSTHSIGAKHYPPKSREDLRRLHDKIQESETDSLKKTCLYYYLLKDFKVDSKFAAEAPIPEQFCQLISGFYALDHLHFEVILLRLSLIEGCNSSFLVSSSVSGLHRQDLVYTAKTFG